MNGIGKHLVVALLLMGFSISLQATNILFTVTGTLDWRDTSGGDGSLDGAAFTFTAQFDDTTAYGDYFTYPSAFPVAGSKVTITPLGASSVSGDYLTGLVQFLPSLAGDSYITDPDFVNGIEVDFGSPVLTHFRFTWDASDSALAAVVGGTPLFSDFGPGVEISVGFMEEVKIGSTGSYSLSGAEISAAAIPEGEYFTLAGGLACLVFVGIRRRRR